MGKSPRHAVHPVNALLNVAFSVTAGRLTALLSASGACPAIGFLHSDKPGRWSLAWDTIEPLRPMIEERVFDFIRRHQFGANDFILTKPAPGSKSPGGHIRLMDNLLKTVIAETAISGRTLDAMVCWMVGLIGSSGCGGKLPPLEPALRQLSES